jgi:phenylacetate-CoA ligase
MVKVKGVNIFPGQVDEVLREVEGASSEYQVMIDHLEGKDIMTVFFETAEGVHREGAEANFRQRFKDKVGLTIVPKAVGIGDLPRSEKKTPRIFDNRY